MGVVTFASLKGGVGKTTLSLNVARAFAERGCETLVIDLDPVAHATRFLVNSRQRNTGVGNAAAGDEHTPESQALSSALKDGAAPLVAGQNGSGQHRGRGGAGNSVNQLSVNSLANSQPALARLCLQRPWDEEAVPTLEAAEQGEIPLITRVRPSLSLVEGGPGLRHLLWGRFARQFQQFFPELISELHSYFDYIVIDTPPDYNVLTRSAIAAADLVVVPVDASSMSIHCLEELIESSAHIKGPTWSILRTMVNKQASRIQQLSTNRLEAKLSLSSTDSGESGIDEAQEFISLLHHESLAGLDDSDVEDEPKPANDDESPIYLLNSVVYRTEQQNKLSFLEKTAFDSRATSKLAAEYLDAAKELEEIISLSGSDAAMEVEDNSMSESFFEMRP